MSNTLLALSGGAERRRCRRRGLPRRRANRAHWCSASMCEPCRVRISGTCTYIYICVCVSVCVTMYMYMYMYMSMSMSMWMQCMSGESFCVDAVAKNWLPGTSPRHGMQGDRRSNTGNNTADRSSWFERRTAGCQAGLRRLLGKDAAKLPGSSAKYSGSALPASVFRFLMQPQ